MGPEDKSSRELKAKFSCWERKFSLPLPPKKRYTWRNCHFLLEKEAVYGALDCSGHCVICEGTGIKRKADVSRDETMFTSSLVRAAITKYQTVQFKAKETNCFTILEARSLKSRNQQVYAPSETCRGNPSLPASKLLMHCRPPLVSHGL